MWGWLHCLWLRLIYHLLLHVRHGFRVAHLKRVLRSLHLWSPFQPVGVYVMQSVHLSFVLFNQNTPEQLLIYFLGEVSQCVTYYRLTIQSPGVYHVIDVQTSLAVQPWGAKNKESHVNKDLQVICLCLSEVVDGQMLQFVSKKSFEAKGSQSPSDSVCHMAHEHVVVQLHVVVEYVVVVSGGLVYLLFKLLLKRRI